MTTVVTTTTVDADDLARILAPRTVPVPELADPDDPHRFTLDVGPFDSYERAVEVGEADADGRVEVTSTTDFQLAIPFWGFLFVGLYVRSLRDPLPPDKPPWWAPPDHIDARGGRSLSLLCVFSIFAAYLGTLLSQTNTYFRAEFGASTNEINDVLIGVRVGAFLAAFTMLVADRKGRRTVLVWATVIGCLITAIGAVAPNLVVLGLSQTAARAFSATVGVLIVIMAAEEMPANSRAFAVSMITMSGALGAGGVVLFLKIADTNVYAWRIFFAVPLLFIIPALRVSRTLPETRRFEVHEEQLADGGDPGGGGSSHVRRFLVLASGAFLFNIFLAPASNNLNDYLRTEQGYDGFKISLMQVITNLPGGISIIVGGRLADRFGRRIIGSIGAAGGVGFTVLMYVSSGWSIWLFSFLGTLIGAIAVPALGVYGPELFPTGSRGKAGGGLNLLAVLGSVVGLKFVGILAGPDYFDGFGTPIALLGVAPAILIVVILLFYPETANRDLEELNPEDVRPPSGAALAALDDDFAEHRLGT